MAGPKGKLWLWNPFFKNQDFLTLTAAPAVVAIDLHQRIRDKAPQSQLLGLTWSKVAILKLTISQS